MSGKVSRRGKCEWESQPSQFQHSATIQKNKDPASEKCDHISIAICVRMVNATRKCHQKNFTLLDVNGNTVSNNGSSPAMTEQKELIAQV